MWHAPAAAPPQRREGKPWQCECSGGRALQDEELSVSAEPHRGCLGATARRQGGGHGSELSVRDEQPS